MPAIHLNNSPAIWGAVSYTHLDVYKRQASWYGLWGPKALPRALVTTLNQMFNAAVKQLDSEGQLARLGIEPVTEAPQQFADYATQYVARNAELLKLAKFEPI